MGHKVHPTAFRLGIIHDWPSRWFSRHAYADIVGEDIRIRKYLGKRLEHAMLARVDIERPSRDELRLTIHTARPGVVISRGGQGIEELVQEIKKLRGKKTTDNKKEKVSVNVLEVKRPYLSAQIVVQLMIQDIEKRMPFRRILKQTLQRIKDAGAQGARVQVAGRLNGTDIARTEHLHFGKIPLHTIRANVDYARGTARTIYGTIGVKIWIYTGEVFEKEPV